MNSMVRFYEKLFDLIDEKKKLVLPTEQAARSLMHSYVQNRGKPVSFSSVMAFDRFLAILFARDGVLRPVDSLTRLLFSRHLIDSHSEKLSYFIPDRSHPEILDRMVYYIASALPGLEDEEALNAGLEKDVAFLKAEYDSFLREAGYYEPSFISSLDNSLCEPYILVMPSSSIEMTTLLMRIKDKRNILTLDVDCSHLGSLTLYENEKQEIRNVFLQIKELVKSGVGLDEIAISTAGYERLRPYFERESYLLDIPLSFMLGKSPLSYPAGRIFSLIDEIHSSSYDIESLKKLLLNASFPLRDRGNAERFILNAISMGISRRDKADRYRYADEGGIYHDLSHYVDGISSTSDPAYLINQVKSLFEKLLAPRQFENDEEDERVLSFLMRLLMAFSEKVQEFRRLGLLNGQVPLFSLFLRYAESVIYVPQGGKDGVRIYPLSEATGVYVPHHFVITLNEDEARKIKRGSSYLSDYELVKERSETDITENLLASYLALSDDVRFSSSTSTYNGYTLPLTLFENVLKAEFLPDSYTDEHIILKEKSIGYDLYPLQKLGHLNSIDGSLSVKHDSEDMAGSLRVTWPEYDKSRHMFSSSQIDKYSRCPFLYASDSIFRISDSRSYEIDSYPALEIGSRLHKVIELYFKKGGGDVEEMVDKYLNLVLDLWQKRKSLDRNLDVRGLSSDVIALSDEMREYVYSKYRDSLILLISTLLEKGTSFCLEEDVKGEIAGLAFVGFLDCVIDHGESVEMIDFKTSYVPKDSVQFDIYRKLYETDKGKTVTQASYATIKDGKVKRPVKFMEEDELETLVSAVADSIAGGDFHGVNSAAKCQNCQARGICRRRYFVR